MMRSEATLAIVRARLHAELPILAVAVAACGLLAYLQRYDESDVRFAGALVFLGLSGMVSALLMRASGRRRELEICEQSAPLYGRELARATALVPCIVVTAALAAYWLAGTASTPLAFSLTSVCALCGYAVALTSLCASVRSGAARALYTVMACAIAVITFSLVQLTPPYVPAVLCAMVAFVALRQYGEALARYNPV